jgi:hypothetical protein
MAGFICSSSDANGSLALGGGGRDDRLSGSAAWQCPFISRVGEARRTTRVLTTLSAAVIFQPALLATQRQAFAKMGVVAKE